MGQYRRNGDRVSETAPAFGSESSYHSR
jgi:hypothetical protein